MIMTERVATPMLLVDHLDIAFTPNLIMWWVDMMGGREGGA